MDNLGLAFDGPIPVAEDNAATRIIAHTGKLTCNVRHIALKMISLQTLVRERIAMFAPSVLPTTGPIILQKLYLNLRIEIIAVTSWVYDFSQLVMPLLLLVPFCLPNYLFILSLSWIFPQFDFFFEGGGCQ
jgi:hypothetical protein